MIINSKVIGVDLGGTNMRAGLINNGAIVNMASAKVPRTDNWEVVMEKLYHTISSVWTKDVTGIGIGVPGIVDPAKGVVYDIQNIPSWIEVEVGSLLKNKFNIPVFVNNDANCFAVGERFFGDGRQFDDFVGLITGTGMGAGIIKMGMLMPDQNCGAGEFGMIPYLDNNYEYYCSGQFFTNVGNVTGEEAALKAISGDPEALELFEQFGKHLGKAIKAILFAIDPAAIIIGGSVSRSYHLYEKYLVSELQTFPYTRTLERITILVSKIPDVAILGAGALVFNNTVNVNYSNKHS